MWVQHGQTSLGFLSLCEGCCAGITRPASLAEHDLMLGVGMVLVAYWSVVF